MVQPKICLRMGKINRPGLSIAPSLAFYFVSRQSSGENKSKKGKNAAFNVFAFVLFVGIIWTWEVKRSCGHLSKYDDIGEFCMKGAVKYFSLFQVHLSPPLWYILSVISSRFGCSPFYAVTQYILLISLLISCLRESYFIITSSPTWLEIPFFAYGTYQPSIS